MEAGSDSPTTMTASVGRAPATTGATSHRWVWEGTALLGEPALRQRTEGDYGRPSFGSATRSTGCAMDSSTTPPLRFFDPGDCSAPESWTAAQAEAVRKVYAGRATRAPASSSIPGLERGSE